MRSQSGKKFLISTTVKFPIRNLDFDLQSMSNWKWKTKFDTSIIFSNQSVTTQVQVQFRKLLLLAILIFWYFDALIFFDIFLNNCPRFSQRCFFNSNFQVAHMRSFHHIFFCVEAKKWSHWQNLYWKSTSH